MRRFTKKSSEEVATMLNRIIENYHYLTSYLSSHNVKTRKFTIKQKIPTPGSDPTGLAYYNDKGILLHVDALSGKLYEINIYNKKVADERRLPISHPWGMHEQGNSIWLTDDIQRVILNLSISDLYVNKRFDYSKKLHGGLKPKNSPDLHGLALINDMLFVNDWMNECVWQVDVNDGSFIGKIDVKIPDLSGLLYYDNSIWVASSTVSYLFRINESGQILEYVKLMDGTYNHIHAFALLPNDQIAFTTKNKQLIIIGEME